jgi:hypothetical protein
VFVTAKIFAELKVKVVSDIKEVLICAAVSPVPKLILVVSIAAPAAIAINANYAVAYPMVGDKVEWTGTVVGTDGTSMDAKGSKEIPRNSKLALSRMLIAEIANRTT